MAGGTPSRVLDHGGSTIADGALTDVISGML
jgi:hypothetical protein